MLSNLGFYQFAGVNFHGVLANGFPATCGALDQSDPRFDLQWNVAAILAHAKIKRGPSSGELR